MKKSKIFLSLILTTSLCLILLSIPSIAKNKYIMGFSNKTTLIVTSKANPTNLTALKQYVEKVMPMLLSLDGEVVKRSKVSDVFYGNSPGEYVLIMDFPDKQKLIDFFKSDAYNSIIPYRNKGFSDINILFADDMN